MSGEHVQNAKLSSVRRQGRMYVNKLRVPITVNGAGYWSSNCQQTGTNFWINRRLWRVIRRSFVLRYYSLGKFVLVSSFSTCLVTSQFFWFALMDISLGFSDDRSPSIGLPLKTADGGVIPADRVVRSWGPVISDKFPLRCFYTSSCCSCSTLNRSSIF